MGSFEVCWRRAVRILWTTRKTNKFVLEKIKPETMQNTAGGKNGKTEVANCGNVMRRQGSVEMLIILGKIKGSRKRGRPIMRWIESIKKP